MASQSGSSPQEAIEGIDHQLLNEITVDSVLEVLYEADGKWYPTKVLEVSKEDYQVLVHYKGWNARFDEWVFVCNSYVRWPGANPTPTKTNAIDQIGVKKNIANQKKSKNTTKKLESPKSTPDKKKTPLEKEYKNGEMVLGLWKDGNKYVCFIQSKCDNTDSSSSTTTYQVKFYDGSRATLSSSKISDVTDAAIKEYEQWKWEEEQLAEYKKKTGKRVKSYSELVQILKLAAGGAPLDVLCGSESALPLSSTTQLSDSFRLIPSSENGSPGLENDSDKYTCEEEGCGKKFRKINLLLHHIKHYHKSSSLLGQNLEMLSNSCSSDVFAAQIKANRSVGEIVTKKKKNAPKLSAQPQVSPIKKPSKKRKISEMESSDNSRSTPNKKHITDSLSSNSESISYQNNSPEWKLTNEEEKSITCQSQDENEIDIFVVEGHTSTCTSPVLRSPTPSSSTTRESGKECSSLVSEGNFVNVSNDESWLELEIDEDASSKGGDEMHGASGRQKGAQKSPTKMNRSKVKAIKPKVKISGLGRFYCTLCGGAFSSKKVYEKHMLIHGITVNSEDSIKSTNKVKVEKDKLVNISSSSSSSSLDKVEKRGDKKQISSSSKVSELAVPSTDLKERNKLTPKTVANSSSADFVLCPVCSQKFPTEDALLNHQKVRLHHVAVKVEDNETTEDIPVERDESQPGDASAAKSDFDVTFLTDPFQPLAFKKTSSKSLKSRQDRRNALLANLKKSKITKTFSPSKAKAATKEHISKEMEEVEVRQPNEVETPETSKVHADSISTAMESDFTPVFLDPPSSADESEKNKAHSSHTETNSPCKTSAIDSLADDETGRSSAGSYYDKAKPLPCTYPGCDKKFRKKSFLELHVKHYHSSKKKQLVDKNYSTKSGQKHSFKTGPHKPSVQLALGAILKNKPSLDKKVIITNKTSKTKKSKSKTKKIEVPEQPKFIHSSSGQLKLKTPVKENYSDILNESISGKNQLSPLSSDTEQRLPVNLSFSVKSVRSSPLKDNSLKSIFKLKFTAPNEFQSPKKHRQRARIDESSESEHESVESEGWSGETIKCVCESTEIFGTMIQCSFCDVWLHAECLTVDESSLPEDYECPYCNAKSRVRSSHLNTDWLKITNSDNPFGSENPNHGFVKQSAPWVTATDQFAQDLHNLQSMIDTLERLNEIMKNPGHVEYPQLVLRFEHVLRTFDVEESKLEHSDLDPNMVKLILELQQNNSRSMSPVDLISPFVTPAKSVVDDQLTVTPAKSVVDDRLEEERSSLSQQTPSSLDEQFTQSVTSAVTDTTGVSSTSKNEMVAVSSLSSSSHVYTEPSSVDSGVGESQSHETDPDIDLDSSLEIDEDDRQHHEQQKSSHKDSPLKLESDSAQTFAAPDEKNGFSLGENDSSEDNDVITTPGATEVEVKNVPITDSDLNQTSPSKCDDVDVLHPLHKSESLDNHQLTAPQNETTSSSSPSLQAVVNVSKEELSEQLVANNTETSVTAGCENSTPVLQQSPRESINNKNTHDASSSQEMQQSNVTSESGQSMIKNESSSNSASIESSNDVKSETRIDSNTLQHSNFGSDAAVAPDFDASKPPRNIVEMINRLIFQLETRMTHLEQMFDQLESGYEQCINQYVHQQQTCNDNIDDEESNNAQLLRDKIVSNWDDRKTHLLKNELFLIKQLNTYL